MQAWARLARFTAEALRGLCSPRTYNSATREVIARQIYFTAWQILPGFTAFVVLLSLIVTHILANAARGVGLSDLALEFTFRLWVLEIMPMLTALFVSLRTGAAVSTEIALMQIRGEMQALEQAGIDPMKLELIPRVIGGTVSMLCLTAIAVVVSALCAHVVISDYRPWQASTARLDLVIAKVFDGMGMLLLWGKAVLFGLAVTAIPIAESMHAPRQAMFAPIAVLRGMVRLFFTVMLIEATGLALRFLL